MGIFGRHVQLVRSFPFTSDGSLNVAGLFAFDGARLLRPTSGTVAPCRDNHLNDWNNVNDFSAFGRNTFAQTDGPGFIEIDLGNNFNISRLILWNRTDTEQARLGLIGCRLCILSEDLTEVFSYTFYTADAYFDFNLDTHKEKQ